ncbi:ParB/Srx family N-terminal domain-containing protein [Nocardioides panacisoli]|uniref:ParB/Srx family N-terminal domain-containing protein n=1 Tax=Nocardioides panacisoli TaxID=627624 RepID=UPI001C63A4D3|nr:ParB/Srx family N-terminal domain-containing protein [Nocardioides panacisoli]QYJ04212.1 ParB/Srx family N-terminal domain-containing protein [Nocardioides panacisoli]
MASQLTGRPRPQLDRWKRRWSSGVHRVAAAGYTGARNAPMPESVRSGLSGRLAWRGELTRVPVDKLLLGGQGQRSAQAFAAATDDLMWSSRRVMDGPHADLLARALQRDLDDTEILASEYATLARRCIALTGEYFSATDDAGIVEVARDFIARAKGEEVEGPRKPRQSPRGMPIRVSPVLDSDCYQVVDGHHRVAALGLAGEETIPVQVNRMGVRTPLQSLLQEMTWIGGERELYQPIDAPELEQWPTVRGCEDRLESIAGFLAGSDSSTYLDVASCYGWFVAAMGDLGHEAEGIERDRLAPTLGSAIYGLDPRQIITADAVDFLRGTDRTWDVVSCFSLLHHFVLGRGVVDAPSLLRLLDKVTGSVLFIDTGQEHERWFSRSLAGWDTAAVQSFLERETSFDKVIDLGPDRDDRPPYSGNYGRHLFACVRDA